MEDQTLLTLVDVRRVGLLPGFATLLLVARCGGGGLLASFLLLSRNLAASGGLASGGGLLLGSLGGHFDDLDSEIKKGRKSALMIMGIRSGWCRGVS